VQWESVLGVTFLTEMRGPPKRELQFELLRSPHHGNPLQNERWKEEVGVKRGKKQSFVEEAGQSTVSWVRRKLAWGENREQNTRRQQLRESARISRGEETRR
jgi:hypothetical protein